MHDFYQSLEKSHNTSDLPMWKTIYEKAFPGGMMVDHRQDGEHQRAGIDRSITMTNSKQILIDEKSRFTDYGDILLEYWSSKERNIPGWVCKPLRADWIAYAIIPRKTCYLLPVLPLQQAWLEFGKEWILRYERIEAKNKGYTTVSVGIPIEELFSKIGKQLRIKF